MDWEALFDTNIEPIISLQMHDIEITSEYAFSNQTLLGHSRPALEGPFGSLDRRINRESHHASHANPASSKWSAYMCCSLQAACFASARCTPDFFAAVWYDPPCSWTRPIDLSHLPFQDLYARFATRLAQKLDRGWDKKSEGAGAPPLYCSALLSYFSGLGDQPPTP